MAKTTSYRGYADATRRFDIEPSPGRERNRFNYVYKRHTTFDAGQLIPFMHMPILPGDTIRIVPRMLVRLSNALISPLMDEIMVNVYFFKSYNRFVFEDWNAFMGEHIQQDPDYDESGENKGGQSLTEPPYNSPQQYELPTLKIPGYTGDGLLPFEIGSLYDYFGLPYSVGNDGYEVQSLPFRHYNLIYNEYFRNENLQDFAPVPKSIGPDKMSQYQVMPVVKYPDYFTGSLPFLQKGPNVSIGLTGDVPVIPDGDNPIIFTDGISQYGLGLSSAAALGGASVLRPGAINQSVGDSNSNVASASTKILGIGDPSGMKVALSPADAVTLAQIRLAFQLQRFYEGQARSGTRYIEYINFMFNEYIPDVQLQRPEYIGGGKFLININPVTQTSESAGQSTPLGTLAAFGAVYDRNIATVNTHCNEHGYIIGLMCVRTNLSYQQGLKRDWSYLDRFDFYTPTLAHLAEQPVYNKELCCTGIATYDSDVFGYIGRYDEYRTMISDITGYFRSNAKVNTGTSESPSYADVSLQSYHLGQFFDVTNPGSEDDNYPGLPHLNANFIKQPKEVIDRVLNISSGAKGVPQFLADISCSIRATRVVSKYGIPGFADHF